MNMTQAERRKIIGASEVGAILGYSKYDSPYDIWMQKTRGKYLERSEAVKIAAEHGQHVESWLLDNYKKNINGDRGLSIRIFPFQVRLPRKKRDILTDKMFSQPPNDYMIAHPDGVVLDFNGDPSGLVEIKTASAYLSDDWDVDESSDNIPVCYLAQVQQQMSIADIKVFVWARGLSAGHLDHIPSTLVEELAPTVFKHLNHLLQQEKIKAYYSTR